MIDQLPIVFESSYEDKKLHFIVARYFNDSVYNKDYVDLAKSIIETFERYVDTFVFKHCLYPLNFKVHMQFEHSTDVLTTRPLIEELAKKYECNYVDKSAIAVVFSTKQNIGVLLPNIAGAFTKNDKNCISNCMFFIIVPVP